MFMPETEDMLPRAAPRPSASVPVGHSDGIIKPTVPEVSILFGEPPQQLTHIQQQQQQQQQSASTQRPVESFATWKKQILPRVNFSPVLVTELGPGSPPATSVSNCNEYNFQPRTRAFYEDRTTPCSNANIGYTVAGASQYPQETYSSDHSQMPAPRVHNSNACTSDVLTICASTQTDLETVIHRRDSNFDHNNLANKQDIREVLAQLELMRQEQQQLRRLCETLAQNQQKQALTSSKTFKETSSQCEIVMPIKSNAAVKPIKPIVQDYIVEEDEQAAAYEAPLRAPPPQFQSPRVMPPIAQSTGYRPNTPQGKPGLASPTVLPKPSTEKSMVMNELALKYLPQRQINELMEEMHVSPKAANDIVPNTTPLRPIDNFTPSPSNMSNASYKYLKKYRLLPEEQLTYDRHVLSSPQGVHKTPRSPAVASPQHQEQMLDLDNIRNKPKLI